MLTVTGCEPGGARRRSASRSGRVTANSIGLKITLVGVDKDVAPFPGHHRNSTD